MNEPEAHESALAPPADLPSQTVSSFRLENRCIPSVSKSMELLSEMTKLDVEIIRHSQKVAQIAVTIGESLNNKGLQLDIRLIEAAALLHDMSRGQPNHAAVAAKTLRKLGYPLVADIVEAHMNPAYYEYNSLNECDVVCFSDKLVQEDRLVPLDVRFQKQLRNHACDPATRALVEKRFKGAQIIRNSIEKALGESIEKLFPEMMT